MNSSIKNILGVIIAAGIIAVPAQLWSINDKISALEKSQSEMSVKINLLMADKHLAQK